MPDIEAIKDAADLPAIVEAITGHPRQGDGNYHCPVCGSGTGPNHSGALHIQDGGRKWYCHSCNRFGDVLDLAGYVLGTDDMGAKKRQVMEWAGIADDAPTSSRQGPRARASTPPRQGPTAQDMERERRFIAEAQSAIADPLAVGYLEGRGIGLEDARALGLGYDSERRRIVIPFTGSDYYHTDRSIDRDGGGKYMKPKGLPQPLWNPSALDGENVIVVEGPMDALALTLAGYGDRTVALAGTAWHPLMEELRGRGYAGTVLLALDADDAGERATVELGAALDEGRMRWAELGAWRALGVKDAGEAWQRDPDAMRGAMAESVPRAVSDAEDRREAAERAAYEATMERLHVVGAGTAIGNVLLLSSAIEPVPTGIRPLDERLGGGMSPGLYVIGATSSLGKSTFMGQIADNLAMAGRPVLFAALEMSAEEMTAKSFSRHIATHPGPDGMAREEGALHFLRPSWRNGAFCDDGMRRAIVDAARDLYDSLGDRLRYLVADSEPTVQDVSDVAYHMKRAHGMSPVIFVDYLQLLKAPEGSLSDKQAVDRNVSTLRRLARDLRTPVVAVSSLNRAGYWGAVTMEAFKESGSIEYGSDVLMGIQPHGMGSELDDVRGDKEAEKKGRQIVNDSKLKMVRDVDITILKNRWGKITGYAEGVHLVYHVIGNYFDELGQGAPFYSSMQP